MENYLYSTVLYKQRNTYERDLYRYCYFNLHFIHLNLQYICDVDCKHVCKKNLKLPVSPALRLKASVSAFPKAPRQLSVWLKISFPLGSKSAFTMISEENNLTDLYESRFRCDAIRIL